MTSVEMKKQIRLSISNLTEKLDDMWLVLQNVEKNSTRYYICKTVYDAYLEEIEVLGGEYRVDDLGRHKIFLWGITAAPTKE